jgi:DnaK suppressor protein
MTDTATRHTELKDMLIERRRKMHGEVQRRIRDGRTDRSQDVCDDVEHSDAGIQGNIDFALLQMRAETLAKIEAALVRLEAGKYGFCFECESPIAERRLRALPFAVRCQGCEERREKEQGRHRHLRERSESVSLFPEVTSS